MKFHWPTLLFVVACHPGLARESMKLQGIEWANESLLGSPVALTVDSQGRVYVTQTVRRKTSELDIREHGDWVTPTLSFESVADREAFYRKELSTGRSAQNMRWLKDRNQDGVADFRDLGVLSDVLSQ